MKLAIDVDGVIYDTQKYIMVYSEIFDVDVLKRNSLVDKNGFWTSYRYNWTEEEERKFSECIREISEKANLVPGAKLVINKLQKLGVEMVVITARGDVQFEDNEQMIETTNRRFKEDNLKFQKVLYRQLDKIEACKNEKVDFMIDDSPIVCEQTSKAGIKTIFLRNSGVRSVEPNPNVTEVSDWGEVYRVITDELRKQ